VNINHLHNLSNDELRRQLAGSDNRLVQLLLDRLEGDDDIARLEARIAELEDELEEAWAS